MKCNCPLLGTHFRAKAPLAAQLAHNEIESGARPRRGPTCETRPCRIRMNPPQGKPRLRNDGFSSPQPFLSLCVGSLPRRAHDKRISVMKITGQKRRTKAGAQRARQWDIRGAGLPPPTSLLCAGRARWARRAGEALINLNLQKRGCGHIS